MFAAEQFSNHCVFRAVRNGALIHGHDIGRASVDAFSGRGGDAVEGESCSLQAVGGIEK